MDASASLIPLRLTRLARLALAAAWLVGALSAAAQTVIGLNFVGGNPTGESLKWRDKAGVVSQQNWNNIFDYAGGATGIWDANGNITALSVNYRSLNTWDVGVNDGTNNGALMFGYLDFNVNTGSTTVTISGISAPIYDVYVYTNGDENARVGKFQIGAQTYWVKDNSNSSTFVQATDRADPGSYAAAAAGNYMVFSGLGESAFTLTATGSYTADGINRAPVNALQVVIPKDILYWDINSSRTGASDVSSANGVWSSSSTANLNWTSSASGSTATSAWADGGVAVFSAGTNATGSSTVTVSGKVNTGAIVVQEGNVTLGGAGTVNFSDSTPDIRVQGTSTATVNAAITNSTVNSALTGLQKSGAGTLVLGSTANAYTGRTVITEGTLKLGASGVIPNTSGVVIASGATLDVSNVNETIGSLAGAGTVKFGGGTLVAGGDNRSTLFSGAFAGNGNFTKAGTGTFTLGSNLDLNGTLTLAGGTLALNGFDLSANSLQVMSNSILDFGAGSSNLNLTNFSIATGVTLTVTNWTDTIDHFYVQNNLGAQGSSPLTQIVFSGYRGSDTRWQSFDSQVTPVPEPATYGALLIGASLGFVLWRRSRRRS